MTTVLQKLYFLEGVPVKEFGENRSIFDEVMTKTWWRTFLTHGVHILNLNLLT